MSEPIHALTIASRPSEESLTVYEVIARAQKIKQVMDALMIEGVHYGKVPGTPKPSLWQPGAEKLLLAFQLAPEHAVTDLSTPSAIRYRVTTRVRHIPTGAFVGEGVGECSSDEEKYRWRKAVCQEEWDETSEDRRRRKWGKGDRGPWQALQVRTEPADIANTVLKMAKKRALVDAAKSTAGASDIFDQDLEDLPPGVEGEPGQPAAGERKVGTPKPKTQQSPAVDPNSPAIIASEKWEPVKARWHDKGTITEPQAKRLIAIGMQSGWSAEEIRREVKLGLDVEISALPYKDPYDLTVGIFSTPRPQV